MGSPRTLPPAGLSSGPLAGNSQPLLCQGAADDVIPPPQTRCGEHGCSLGVQSSSGTRAHPHHEQAWGEHHPKLVSEPRAGIRVLRCWNVQRKEQGARAELWLPVPAPTILHTQPIISLSEETPSPLGPASSQADPDIPIPTCTCAAWPRKRGKTQPLGHGKMISQR